MPNSSTLRIKILALSLSLIFILALGAEIKSGLHTGLFREATPRDTSQTSSISDDHKRGLRDQFRTMNRANMVASRFLAPTHAPITWVR